MSERWYPSSQGWISTHMPELEQLAAYEHERAERLEQRVHELERQVAEQQECIRWILSVGKSPNRA